MSPESNPDWALLAKLNLALVIYMGVARCREIQAALLDAGKAPSTPAAIIQSATAGGQAQCITTLEQLSVAIAASGIGSPSIIVIGDVVRYASQVNLTEQAWRVLPILRDIPLVFLGMIPVFHCSAADPVACAVVRSLTAVRIG